MLSKKIVQLIWKYAAAGHWAHEDGAQKNFIGSKCQYWGLARLKYGSEGSLKIKWDLNHPNPCVAKPHLIKKKKKKVPKREVKKMKAVTGVVLLSLV